MEIKSICNYREWKCNQEAKYRKIINYKGSSSNSYSLGMNEWLYCEDCWAKAQKSSKGLLGSFLDMFDND